GPDSALGKQAAELLGEWDELQKSRDPEAWRRWTRKADALLDGRSGSKTVKALCDDKSDPDHGACVGYFQAVLGAQKFFNEWLNSRTAEYGQRFYPADLGLKDQGIKYFAVGGAGYPDSADGKHKEFGLRTYNEDGSETFASWGGELQQVQGMTSG